MKTRELQNLGVPRGEAMRAAQRCAAAAGLDHQTLRARIGEVVKSPGAYEADPVFGELARALAAEAPTEFVPRRMAPYELWGKVGEDFEKTALDQLRAACGLPVAVRGALMPDAHVGYGLPIGGVLATEGAVIPYAVGVDIACRVRLSVLDLPVSELESDRGRDRLTKAIETETRFGIGAEFGGKRDRGTRRREHGVMDENWSVSPVTACLRDKAWSQLGTSGSGNHFVEFGTLTIDDPEHARVLGVEPGIHMALLSHSGSRGVGASVCDHYSKVAMSLHPDLPKQQKYLAWLDLDSQAGREYWEAMNLMGRYASANHALIHEHILKHLGARAIGAVENHHNFAWKEVHDVNGEARELIVHRKGATPAGAGVLGVIPGSMAQPGYVVRGLGGEDSLASAAHGAGRVMSRTAAKKQFRWGALKDYLRERGVTVISAGIDENPHVYKDIRTVMSRQRDLVEPIARFDPRLVKMAPEGERAED